VTADPVDFFASAHAACPDVLRAGMAPFEVIIAPAPPPAGSPWTDEGFRCPHGVSYWIIPTEAEAARMAAADAAAQERGSGA
jgi:hypothetical protein